MFFYLAPIIPFRVDGIINDFGSEFLSSDVDNSVGVGFSFSQDADIFFHEIFGFYNVDS